MSDHPTNTEADRIRALVPGIELIETDLTKPEDVKNFFDLVFGTTTEEEDDKWELLSIYFAWISRCQHSEGADHVAVNAFLWDHGVRGPAYVKRLEDELEQLEMERWPNG